MVKKIEPTGDLCIKFTEDELLSLGLQENDKLSCKIDNNSILLQKYETLELDLSEFDRDKLEFLILESCKKDISVSEVISNILEKTIKDLN
jgi:hypothetical protein